MKSAQLLTVACSMIACTHANNNCTISLSDSVQHTTNRLPNSSISPVTPVKRTQAAIAPEMPFFKDVLDSKRLFW